MNRRPEIELSDEEIELLLGDCIELHGYDFTNYSRASLRRRLQRLISNDRFVSFAEFRFNLRDKEYFKRFVEEITVTVTEMFRDPSFYQTLRNEVIPQLATQPLIRIWHAGCSTGEEVYSMAILLHEANLLDKSLLYATDINPSVLENVRKGIFPLRQMKQYSENYVQSGGRRDFSSYYIAQYSLAKFDDMLSRRMVLSTHNLVSDGSFNEFHLILCRNVLIYFDKPLQDKVLQLFYESMPLLGYLALGARESLKFTSVQNKFQQIGNREKIWRKIT